MIKQVLYCTDNGEYFKSGDGWSTQPVLKFVKPLVKACRYGFTRRDADAIKLVTDCAFMIGLTLVVKQLDVTEVVTVIHQPVDNNKEIK